jgi:hypothetical protein
MLTSWWIPTNTPDSAHSGALCKLCPQIVDDSMLIITQEVQSGSNLVRGVSLRLALGCWDLRKGERVKPDLVCYHLVKHKSRRGWVNKIQGAFSSLGKGNPRAARTLKRGSGIRPMAATKGLALVTFPRLSQTPPSNGVGQTPSCRVKVCG